ncbi:hypothetical protein ACI7RC_10705 [Brevibacillus sp. B_LB10_24]|uniref:hypothetical protein n=1 Tax=Brevibacillus sp. B_LB10_24 TaxID=3380645 RepID=UPI0038B6C11D
MTDKQGEEFLIDIKNKMIELFNITEEEAVGRINRMWSGKKLIGDEQIVYHEDDTYWAKTIYYGKSSFWWLKEGEEIKPIPYP